MTKGVVYLLDTNIISYWMRGEQRLIKRLQQYAPAELSLSTITLAEILYGIEKSPFKKRERRTKIEQISSVLEIYPFDEAATARYAGIRVQLEKKGRPISERDTQIAAIALSNGLVLVTHNVKEFHRIDGLKIEDWALSL